MASLLASGSHSVRVIGRDPGAGPRMVRWALGPFGPSSRRWVELQGRSVSNLDTAKTSIGGRVASRKGVDMADKSPRKAMSKKPSKSLKEKRREKKDKGDAQRRIV